MLIDYLKVSGFLRCHLMHVSPGAATPQVCQGMAPCA